MVFDAAVSSLDTCQTCVLRMTVTLEYVEEDVAYNEPWALRDAGEMLCIRFLQSVGCDGLTGESSEIKR